MGVDHNAYIGPYVRVTETVQKKKGDKCEKHDRGDAAYCPKCGASKKDRYYDYEDNGAPDGWESDYKKNGKKVEFWDYLSTTCCMSSPEVVKGKRTCLYVANRYHKELNIPDIDGGKYSEEEVPFDAMNVQATIDKFKLLFADELAYLEKWFEVEVKFGYVSWCS